MSEKRIPNVIINNAGLIFKNFQGKGSQYNAEGNRKFGVKLEDELAEQLEKDGWNVKYLRPREDDPEQYRQPWLEVKVKFNPYPPIAYLITSRGKKKLDEETIDQLDWSYIQSCDLKISPYQYPAMVGKDGSIMRPAGIAAYLKAIYATIREDELEARYSDMPDLDEEERPFE